MRLLLRKKNKLLPVWKQLSALKFSILEVFGGLELLSIPGTMYVGATDHVLFLG